MATTFTNRPPVPQGPPPTYARAVSRVYRNSLRPIVLFICGVSAVWSLATAINLIKNRGDEGSTKKMNTFDLIEAILYFLAAGLEGFGIFAALTQRLRLVYLYIFASAGAGILTLAAAVIRLAMHFVLKNDIKHECQVINDDATVVNSSGRPIGSLSDQGTIDYCDSIWNRGIWWQIFYILISLVFGFFFTCIAAAYYHQLLNPASMRQSLAPSTAYNLQTFGPGGPGGRDPHFNPPSGAPPGHYGYGDAVPPYPGFVAGPPKYDGAQAHTPTEEKTSNSADYSPAPTAGGAGGLSVGRSMDDADSTSTVTLEPPRGHRDAEGRV